MESKIWITEHSGKMENIRSISTNPLSNGFCQYMHKFGGSNCICKKCYATDLVSFRGSLRDHMEKNSAILSSVVLLPNSLPKYNDDVMRFNSFGEIINATHMVNIIMICLNNLDTTHVLYTKRMNIVEQFEGILPPNLIIVESNPNVDCVRKYPQSRVAHYVFNVVTKKYAEENGLKISCIQKCSECMRCYNVISYCNNNRIIIELIK